MRPHAPILSHGFPVAKSDSVLSLVRAEEAPRMTIISMIISVTGAPMTEIASQKNSLGLVETAYIPLTTGWSLFPGK
jgi:hypothetical protein